MRRLRVRPRAAGNTRRPCSALIESGGTRVLIDAGLIDLHERFAPGSLSAIVLTHFHPDHVQGLFHLRWGKVHRFPCHAPPDSEGCADLYKIPGLLDFSRTPSSIRQWERCTSRRCRWCTRKPPSAMRWKADGHSLRLSHRHAGTAAAHRGFPARLASRRSGDRLQRPAAGDAQKPQRLECSPGRDRGGRAEARLAHPHRPRARCLANAKMPWRCPKVFKSPPMARSLIWSARGPCDGSWPGYRRLRPDARDLESAGSPSTTRDVRPVVGAAGPSAGARTLGNGQPAERGDLDGFFRVVADRIGHGKRLLLHRASTCLPPRAGSIGVSVGTQFPGDDRRVESVDSSGSNWAGMPGWASSSVCLG